MKPLPLRTKLILGLILAAAALFAVAKVDVWYTEHNAQRGLDAAPGAHP